MTISKLTSKQSRPGTSPGSSMRTLPGRCLDDPGIKSRLASEAGSVLQSYAHSIFTGDQISALSALPKRRKFNQNYFLEEALLSLSRQRWLNRRRNAAINFVTHMEN
jgi:hypothetical protein